MEYFLIVFYLVALVYVYDLKNYKNYKKTNINFVLLVFIILAGFRYRVGPDTISYMLQFEELFYPLSELEYEDFLNIKYQPIWILLNSFCKSVGNFILLQFIVASVINICVFYFFKKTTTKLFSALLIYFLIDYLYFNTDVMREAMAVGLFLVGIVKLQEKKLFLYYFIITICVLIHLWSFVCFFVPILLTKKVSYKLKIFIGSVIFFFIISMSSATESLNNLLILLNVNRDLTAFASFDQEGMSYLGYIYNFLRFIPLLLIILFYRKNRQMSFIKIPKRYVLIFCSLYVYILLIRIFAIPFIERYLNYFIVFVHLILISFSYDVARNYFKRNSHFVVILTFIFCNFFFYLAPFLKISPLYGVRYYKIYYPYYSIFSENIDPDREKIIRYTGKE